MDLIGDGKALAAFHAALGDVESVRKSEEADMGKFTVRYASLNAVHAECERACEVHGLRVVQEPTVVDGLFAVVNTLIHADLSMLRMEPMCLPLPKDAQALGSATTYLRRYSLVSQFGLAVEDDDGRAATVSAQAQPGRRTEAERMIRESIAQMPEEQRKRFQEAFKAQFASSLTDLPAARHGDALTWAREWEREDSADEQWVGEAEDHGPEAPGGEAS